MTTAFVIFMTLACTLCTMRFMIFVVYSVTPQLWNEVASIKVKATETNAQVRGADIAFLLLPNIKKISSSFEKYSKFWNIATTVTAMLVFLWVATAPLR